MTEVGIGSEIKNLAPMMDESKRREEERLRAQTADFTEMDVSDRRLKLEIDYGRCQGHARCVMLAPELLETDEYGNGKVRNDGLIKPELIEKARHVQRNCPEFAIRIDEWET